MAKPRVVFFGTPQFAAETLQHLLEQEIEVVAVVTQPDRPRGRSGKPAPQAVKLFLEERYPNIPLHQPEKASTDSFMEILRTYKADLFVVVAYGEIIKEQLLKMPPLGCINVHASLLPKYRGAAPIQHAILKGERVTGTTIMHMAKKMDAGDIIQQDEVPIRPSTTLEGLTKQLCSVGKEALISVIDQLAAGKAPRTPQDHSQATFAPKITPEDGRIDWTRSAAEIDQQVRALYPKPAAWTTLELGNTVKRLKILRAQVVEQAGEPGAFLSFDPSQWVIASGSQALLVQEVQLEGKRAMPAEEVVRGLANQQVRRCQEKSA